MFGIFKEKPINVEVEENQLKEKISRLEEELRGERLKLSQQEERIHMIEKEKLSLLGDKEKLDKENKVLAKKASFYKNHLIEWKKDFYFFKKLGDLLINLGRMLDRNTADLHEIVGLPDMKVRGKELSLTELLIAQHGPIDKDRSVFDTLPNWFTTIDGHEIQIKIETDKDSIIRGISVESDDFKYELKTDEQLYHVGFDTMYYKDGILKFYKIDLDEKTYLIKETNEKTNGKNRKSMYFSLYTGSTYKGT